ncbi:Unknown protein [Striga hermonthica]|uniref:Stress response protein NST1-like n=1 Tax=Striga hermonthica TaxID=68872 RepID=A0A9N7RQ07_STRHE|nr:Unknown protein [Striga hermonthica]
MKRKKWSELEEQTLLSKYSDLLNSGTLAKLRTREKKFRPVADHVNSLHHLRDPIAFPFRWSWRDVSIKVQNMRHQYLGVKQKIRISGNEFNWGDGEIHWENFLKYKQVFGDIELSDNGVRVDASNNANSGQVMNSNDKSSNSKTIGDESIYSDIFGYGEEDIEETDEYDDEGADIGASEEGGKGGKEGSEDEKNKLGIKGKKLRMVVTKVLELREAILRREDKRREREWNHEVETERKEREVRATKRMEEVAHKREMELDELRINLARKEFEGRARLERELEKEKRLRMSFQEKWDEREMEWREKLFEVQMQHEKQMMQMHADACQSQLQILGVVSRLVCQIFGSATDGLGGAIGALAQPGLQNLEHPAGLGDGGKPDATSPSEFL